MGRHTDSAAWRFLKLGVFFIILLTLGACISTVSKQPETTAKAPVVLTATVLTPTLPLTATPPPPTPAPSFTTTSTAVVAASPAVLDSAHFVSETLVDYSQLEPGEKFKKSWKLKNNSSVAWTEGYELFLVSSSQADERMSSPEVILLPAVVNPGEETEISVELAAPQEDGVYTLYYGLRNAAGQHFLVDGGNLWVTVVVGNLPLNDAVSGGNPAYTPQLLSWNQTPQSTNVQFCMPLPDSTPSWFPFDIVLIAGSRQMAAAGGGVLNYQPGSFRCYWAEFNVGTAELDTSAGFQVSIDGIGIDAAVNQKENCTRAQSEVKAAHLGLGFSCGSPGFYYTLTQKPAGMSDAEADRIIMDALERRTYGPWVLYLN